MFSAFRLFNERMVSSSSSTGRSRSGSDSVRPQEEGGVMPRSAHGRHAARPRCGGSIPLAGHLPKPPAGWVRRLHTVSVSSLLLRERVGFILVSFASRSLISVKRNAHSAVVRNKRFRGPDRAVVAAGSG